MPPQESGRVDVALFKTLRQAGGFKTDLAAKVVANCFISGMVTSSVRTKPTVIGARPDPLAVPGG